MSETDSKAAGDSLDKAEYQIDNNACRADCRQCICSQCAPDDHGIRQRIKELKKISADHGK